MDETREGYGPPAEPTAWATPDADGRGGWGYGPVPDEPWAARPPQPPRARRRGVPVAVTAALALLAAAAGVGVGHQVWHTPGVVSATVLNGGNPVGSAGSAAGSGQGGSGLSPFGLGQGSGQGQGGQGQGGGQGQSGGAGAGAPSNVGAIAGAVDPALVDVNSTFGYQSAAGAGTGIVLTSTGEILTNNHVINGATSVSVTDIGNGKTYPATVVGYDSTHDIAVLQLQGASGLQTAKLAGNAAAVGEPVVAIGNAGGTGGTPSSAGGSVTAVDQAITAGDELDGSSEQLTGLIQVNADVQSGDSGGSLVDASGAVIGMDTAASSQFSFQSPGGTSGGDGYAIPIAQATAIANQIVAGGGGSDVHVGATAFLGVLITPTSGNGQGSSGAPGGGLGQSPGGAAQGAGVSGVLSGGTAQSAGIAQGDVITSLNGQSVTSASDLTKLVGGLRPGQHVELGWVDTSGQAHTQTVDLGSGPPA
jgi:S1-C subfamily serine protease